MTETTQPSACALLRSALEAMRTNLEQLAELQGRLDDTLPRNTLPPELLKHYNQQLDRLLEAEALRAEALDLLGLSPQQMNDALRRCPSADLVPLWTSIREALPRVALNNRKHAQVLSKATASIHAALALLGGLPAQPSLYGPRGRPETTSGGRTLGSA